jgi:NADH dehydrogenase
MEIVLREIDRKRLLVPVPFPIATVQAAALELAFLLPKMLNLGANPPVTVDQVVLLRHDNVVTGNLPGLEDLGVDATALETIVPSYLRQFRRGVWHT